MTRDWRSSLGWTVCLFLFCITGCATPAAEDGNAKDLPIIARWSGDFPVADLALLPDGQRQSGTGYIDGQNALIARVRPKTTDAVRDQGVRQFSHRRPESKVHRTARYPDSFSGHGSIWN